MIYWVRTASISGNAMDAGFAWAVKVAGWVNGKLPGANVQVLRNVSGPLQEVRWIMTADSLAELEQRTAAVEGDAEYQAMIAEARSGGLFVQGTLRDSIFRTIP